jgi:Na+/H+ antiporter NhaD/arsenite permease-like protein
MEAGYLIPCMIAVFSLGYLLIALESLVDINKATTALIMGTVLWILEFSNPASSTLEHTQCLSEHFSNVSQVIIFLLCALIIVEIINSHQGFRIFSSWFKFKSKKMMLWAFAAVTFFLSAILDNLTTTIVMVAILQKMVHDKNDRLLIGGAIVIAANAGGVWTPIGDITTTMLWIGDRITTQRTIIDLFTPSLFALLASLICLTPMLKGKLKEEEIEQDNNNIEPLSLYILGLGIAALVFVPVFKYWTGMPPFMGILFGLSVLWMVTELIHRKDEKKEHLRVSNLLSHVDLSGPLFFLGILLAVNALDSAGILSNLASSINNSISSPTIIATLIGLASAIVDNIPLVLATMGMYDVSHYPVDSQFWQLIAYCAGTGGSILIVGSAAGVVFMGIEKVDFFSYFKKISFAAMVGYFVGIGVYLLIGAY